MGGMSRYQQQKTGKVKQLGVKTDMAGKTQAADIAKQLELAKQRLKEAEDAGAVKRAALLRDSIENLQQTYNRMVQK